MNSTFTVASIYNPAIQSKEHLIEGFSVRKRIFQKIADDIKTSSPKKSKQSYLIIGQRGMGKTTLLLRLAYEVENNPQLNTWLIPITFPEEQYNMRKLYQLWEETAKELEKYAEVYKGLFNDMESHYERHEDDWDYERYCFGLLKQRLRQNGNKLILFIDNFDVLIGKKGISKRGRQRLREILINESDLRLVVGSVEASEYFFSYDEPFYHFFKTIYLEGLSQEETQSLLLGLEGKGGTLINQIIKKTPERIESLRQLTGGVVRTIVLLFEIFIDHKNNKAFADLELVLDRVTALYKHRLDDLDEEATGYCGLCGKKLGSDNAFRNNSKTPNDRKRSKGQYKNIRQKVYS